MSERELRLIYNSYMEAKNREGKKRKHPSFEEFCDLVQYLKAWTTAIEVISEQNKEGVQVDDQ